MCIFHTRSVTIFIYNSYSLYLFFNACCKAKYYDLRDKSPLTYYFYLNECSFSLIFFTLQNVGKFISEHLARKFFRGSMPPDPPSNTSRLRRSCCTPLAYRDITVENHPLRLSHGLTPMHLTGFLNKCVLAFKRDNHLETSSSVKQKIPRPSYFCVTNDEFLGDYPLQVISRQCLLVAVVL